jgi:putative ABC transport system substrate-binding protein
MSNSLTDIASKHLDVLHELLPHVSRLAVLIRPRFQSHRAALKLLQESAPRIGVHVLPIVAESAPEIRDGFAAMTQQKAQALVVVIDPLYFEQLSEIAELALKAKLPSIGYSSAFANAGFLVGYGPNTAEFYRQAAVYVDKILKGAKPRDLPVAQPTKFEFVINLKTAKILGVTIPRSALSRADQVIE